MTGLKSLLRNTGVKYGCSATNNNVLSANQKHINIIKAKQKKKKKKKEKKKERTKYCIYVYNCIPLVL